MLFTCLIGPTCETACPKNQVGWSKFAQACIFISEWKIFPMFIDVADYFSQCARYSQNNVQKIFQCEQAVIYF